MNKKISYNKKSKDYIIPLFDLSVANPPFQDSVNRNTTPHKLWIDFTHRQMKLLQNDGTLAQISPNSFLSPSSKILKYFLENNTTYLGLDTSKFFDVGSTFSDYVIKKRNPNSTEACAQTHIIEPNGVVSYGMLDESIYYLPNDFNSISLSIHKKVMFSNALKLNVKYDYVSCHNVNLKGENSSLSKTKTATHIYPVFHTNPQIWWSSVRQDFAHKKKVMWTRSGYTKPFYDEGIYGTTDMGYYVEVSDKNEGDNLVHNLNSKLFQYIFKTARWSGFGNELVFLSLPSFPDKKLTDSEMFSLFSLSDEEIDYILKSTLKVSKQKTKQIITTNINRDVKRVAKTAEVFTCDELADRLIHRIDEKYFLSDNSKILESSAGNGQLVLAILRKMKDLGRTDWRHILENQLFICEYMQDNIEELISRVSAFINLDIKNLNHNIIWADFMSFSERPFLLSEWKSHKYSSIQTLRLS